MNHIRFYRLLVILILAVTAVSLLSHYAADAICLADGLNETTLCSNAPASQFVSTPAAAETLHTGFDVPTVTAVTLLAAFIFSLITLQYTAVSFSPAPLSPPPKR